MPTPCLSAPPDLQATPDYPLQVPRELKRHLFSIEEKILEAQAWEKGSSLYPLLVAACSPARTSADRSPPGPGDADTPMEDSPRDHPPKVGTCQSSRSNHGLIRKMEKHS